LGNRGYPRGWGWGIIIRLVPNKSGANHQRETKGLRENAKKRPEKAFRGEFKWGELGKDPSTRRL